MRLSQGGHESAYRASVVEPTADRYEHLLTFAMRHNPTYTSYMHAYRRSHPSVVLFNVG